MHYIQAFYWKVGVSELVLTKRDGNMFSLNINDIEITFIDNVQHVKQTFPLKYIKRSTSR